MSPYVTAESILCAKDLDTAEVEVPEWGGTVRVRKLSGSDRELYDQEIHNIQQRVNRGARNRRGDIELDIQFHAHKARVLLAWLTICDENGERIFTTEEHRKQLAGKSAEALERVYQCAARLSGLLAEDEDEDADSEEGEKRPGEGGSVQLAPVSADVSYG